MDGTTVLDAAFVIPLVTLEITIDHATVLDTDLIDQITTLFTTITLHHSQGFMEYVQRQCHVVLQIFRSPNTRRW